MLYEVITLERRIIDVVAAGGRIRPDRIAYRDREQISGIAPTEVQLV